MYLVGSRPKGYDRNASKPAGPPHTSNVVVASATVIVSFSVTVDTAVTVMKMLVVMPLTLVLVLVPSTARCPLPPLSSSLPLPEPAFSVVAGAMADVDVVACVMGTTRRGASSDEEVDDGDGDGRIGVAMRVVVVGVCVCPGFCTMIGAVALVSSAVVVDGSADVVIKVFVASELVVAELVVAELVVAELVVPEVKGKIEGEGVCTVCCVTESVEASELVRVEEEVLASSSEAVFGGTVTSAVDDGTVTVTTPPRPVAVVPVSNGLVGAPTVVDDLLLRLSVLLAPSAPADDVLLGRTVT